MLNEERLSAAFQRWDRNRTLLHARRRQLAAAVAAFERGELPDPVYQRIEVECLDELCTELFAELLAVADDVDAARDRLLAVRWAAEHEPD